MPEHASQPQEVRRQEGAIEQRLRLGLADSEHMVDDAGRGDVVDFRGVCVMRVWVLLVCYGFLAAFAAVVRALAIDCAAGLAVACLPGCLVGAGSGSAVGLD